MKQIDESVQPHTGKICGGDRASFHFHVHRQLDIDRAKSVDARLCVPAPSNSERNDCFSIRLVFIPFLLCVFDGLDAFINSVGYNARCLR